MLSMMGIDDGGTRPADNWKWKWFDLWSNGACYGRVCSVYLSWEIEMEEECSEECSENVDDI